MKKQDKKSHKKVNSRGASRTENKQLSTAARFKWGRFILSLVFIGVVGALAPKLNWQGLVNKVTAATHRPLANVQIESEFRFVSKQELQDIVISKLDGNFVDLDLKSVKKTIESNPWIEHVSITRMWPDSIKLEVREHKPIARWNNNAYISHEGDLIKVDTNTVLAKLPSFSGEKGQSSMVTKNYVLFTELLKSSDLNVSAIVVDKKNAWSVEVNGEILLVLGSSDIHERMENFKYVYDSYLINKRHDIVRVDMRYESGLAVKWQKDSDVIAANNTIK